MIIVYYEKDRLNNLKLNIRIESFTHHRKALTNVYRLLFLYLHFNTLVFLPLHWSLCSRPCKHIFFGNELIILLGNELTLFYSLKRAAEAELLSKFTYGGKFTFTVEPSFSHAIQQHCASVPFLFSCPFLSNVIIGIMLPSTDTRLDTYDHIHCCWAGCWCQLVISYMYWLGY